jgi:uncharacterized membrane protein YoaK (UPF0700 family)
MLNPSRNVVLALLAYIVGAIILTLALGDLGDVGFWIVWIPLVLFAFYLIVVGIARLAGTARRAT